LTKGFSNSIVVVAPGCTSGLITELLNTCIQDYDGHFDILLSPENSGDYDLLMEKHSLGEKIKFFRSPAHGFFSIDHLKWIRKKIEDKEKNYLLIPKSPYKDAKTALVSIIYLLLGRRTVTLLFATPEAIIKTDDQKFSDKWISQDINSKIFIQEINKTFVYFPLFLLYLFIFWGLIFRKRLKKFFQSTSS
jgi:hypothetical protein